MAIDLRGKPIAITGASSGIGAATALACAKAGMPVALGARRTNELEKLAQQIRAQGGRAINVTMDVTDPAGCEALVKACVKEFGSIYSVYANAGYGLESTVEDTSDQAMRQIFEVNFFGTLNTIRPAIPYMKRAKAGHVLICSSCIAKLSVPYYAAYSATKAAQAHVGRAMNLELEPFGIHTTIVCPVGTKTEFFDKVKTETGGDRLVEHTPKHAMQTADTVAQATLRALRKPRPEVWTSRWTRIGMAMCAAFPGVEHRFLRKMVADRAKAIITGRQPSSSSHR
jgi:short-subunit dehydrogenase